VRRSEQDTRTRSALPRLRRVVAGAGGGMRHYTTYGRRLPEARSTRDSPPWWNAAGVRALPSASEAKVGVWGSGSKGRRQLADLNGTALSEVPVIAGAGAVESFAGTTRVRCPDGGLNAVAFLADLQSQPQDQPARRRPIASITTCSTIPS
jgi:hypothetical protein